VILFLQFRFCKPAAGLYKPGRGLYKPGAGLQTVQSNKKIKSCSDRLLFDTSISVFDFGLMVIKRKNPIAFCNADGLICQKLQR
jgi:hypothetical protein